jgi:hypothetical protein
MKKAGPLEEILMERAMIRNKGEKKINNNADITISIILLLAAFQPKMHPE